MLKRILPIVLCLVTMPATSQMLADFETSGTIPVFSAEGESAVLDNPDKTGINTSDKVGYYDKLEGNWHYVSMNFTTPVEIGYNNTLKFKVHASQKGRVFAKFWNSDQVLIENWAPVWDFMPEANTWTECHMDLSPVLQKSFTKLQLAVCIDNNAQANVFFDDIELANPELADGFPKVLFTAAPTKITAGDSLSFDASASFDYDGSISSYYWDFGDGNSSVNQNVTYQYNNAGSYWASLTITDNEGKSSTDSTAIFVFGHDEKVSSLLWTSDKVAVNEKAEAIFQIKKAYSNVFDPDEVRVDALITLADNSILTVPCFYFINSYASNTQWLVDSSYQGWMLRFASSLEGDADVSIRISDSSETITAAAETIHIYPGSTRGIIRNDAVNTQYYRHAGGEPYYPLGINIGWNNINDYTRIINNLSANNANLFRYWHTPFAQQALEWKNDGFYQGLGQYNQQAAAMTDSLIELGFATNMYMQLVIFQHGMFSENVNEMWEDNPYNLANGGFVNSAEEYFYNTDCKNYTKKLLRYIVARWSYAGNIFAWEFFNEVQFTGVYEAQTALWYPGVQQWHSEMSRYMEAIDPYKHILTSSAADDMLADFDTIAALDVLQYHLYSNHVIEKQKELDYHFKEELSKSIINGEYGLSTDAEMTFEGQGHAIWNSLMTEVPHFMWIWEHYLNEKWAHLFHMPYRFIEAENMAAMGTLSPFGFSVNAGTELSTTGLTGEGYYSGYIYDMNNSGTISGAKLVLPDIPFGYYNLSYYLPVEDTIIEQKDTPFIQLSNKLDLPDFTGGFAFKIKYTGEYNLPIAIAGNDTATAPGVTLSFSGVNSVSPRPGSTLNYSWQILEKPDGSNIGISDQDRRDIEITPDVSGHYRISLTVNDGVQSSLPDELNISVSNRPVAIAGTDTTIDNSGRYYFFDGSQSYDPDGDKISYLWEIAEKPDGSSGSLLKYDQADAVLKIDATGIFKCTLKVNDGVSSSMADTISVQVIPVGIQQFTSPTVKVYPNPSTGSFWIKSNEFIDKVEVYSVSGKKTAEYCFKNQAHVHIANLQSNGLLILKIHSFSGVTVKPVLITLE